MLPQTSRFTALAARPTVAVAAVLSLLIAHDAVAREWRGCRASIEIIAEGKPATLWEFEGRGSCRSRVRANDCRRAARDVVANCVRGAWRDRWERKLPGECAPGNEGARRRAGRATLLPSWSLTREKTAPSE